ncbi:MAG: class I SAM-dependent methyltransferase [Myxococcales bacterium]|jgi:O-methyltransferase involved in polyketide biosynthesis
MKAEAVPPTRDYSSISPSALSLLLMKAESEIPYAREAAAALWGDTAPSELSDALAEENARRRLRHFVNRYKSLDQLLSESGCANVLELGAGLSFRGLDLARTKQTFYIDTDLPNVVALKAELIAKLPAHPSRGTLRVQALNALDADAFAATVSELPPGPVAIANEGLLVYLDEREKAQLAANVRAALLSRGGVWLTADVYIQNPGGSSPNVSYGRSRAFLDQHRVEQNKFSDWSAAERFFTSQGLTITNKLAHAHPLHIRESWALALSG